ncbi:unnamed protein product [Anisakis simplex]|uniref:Protein kinase domain-containing protein n=1 Tax=Anisakis simplex TaxID=6269 RepID=A0A3P6QWD9_ANISI|nr:unnamed protein product [Anisakis simplex]
MCTWTVVRKLGEGGFGAVYLVKDQKNAEFALKAEAADQSVKVLHLELRKANTDKGNKQERFTLGCAISVGVKCLEAIEELHGVGYLHRDIKPANYAIDKRDLRKIYLLDLGLCRKYVSRNGEIRAPRWAAGFRGTIRYAALSCHISREQCRKDDLESWLYQQVELTTGNLPWKCLEQDKKLVAQSKEKCRTTSSAELFKDSPVEYSAILKYIDSLSYYATPDYRKMKTLMQNALVNNNVKEYPYDWES